MLLSLWKASPFPRQTPLWVLSLLLVLQLRHRLMRRDYLQKESRWSRRHPNLIMEITVKVPKGAGPFNIFRDRLFNGLSFLQQYGEDATIAFLPKQDCPRAKAKPPLLISSDFPQVQCNMRLYYFSFPNAYSFSPVKNDSGRRIVFSTWMGFNVNPEDYLA